MKMNKMLVSLFVLAISIAFVSAVPAAQAWQEHGKSICVLGNAEEETLSQPNAACASAPKIGQFSAQEEFTGKVPPIYYREKYPDEIPL